MPQDQAQKQQQAGQPKGDDGAHRWLGAIIDGIGYSVEVFVHQDIGERRIRDMGAPFLFALIALAMLTLCTVPMQRRTPLGWAVPAHGLPDARPDLPTIEQFHFWIPLVFCVLAIIANVRQRFRAWRRSLQGGPPINSYYTGLPSSLKQFRLFYPGLTELGCKRIGEPLLVCAMGICVAFVSPHLGLYLMLAAAVMRLTVSMRVHQERELALDAADGVIDMLAHQENVGAMSSPQPQKQAAARVVVPAAAPRPEPARPKPSRPRPPKADAPQRPASSAVPSALYEGLNENLLRLLKEEHKDE